MTKEDDILYSPILPKDCPHCKWYGYGFMFIDDFVIPDSVPPDSIGDYIISMSQQSCYDCGGSGLYKDYDRYSI